jgi:hypothetical protein
VMMRLLGLLRVRKPEAPSDTPKPAQAPPSVSSQPDGGPYAQGIAQLRLTARWMTGALAAVASVMVAGSQLSSIGKLSWNEDGGRLWAAIVAVVVAVLAVVLAIYLLTRAQMPGDSNLQSLAAAAKDPSSKLAKAAQADPSFTRGRKDIDAFLKDLAAARRSFYERKAVLADREEDVLNADAAHLGDAEAARDKAAKYLALAEVRLDDLRKGQRALSELDVYLNIRRKFAVTSPGVLASALVAAGGFIVFAWAANPSDRAAAAGDAIPQQPSLARLVLNASQATNLKHTLGADCAQAATRPGGIPVIALSATKDEVEVVLIPSRSCPEPTRVGVPPGEVIAVRAVVPG